jgi:hypothetical protein
MFEMESNCDDPSSLFRGDVKASEDALDGARGSPFPLGDKRKYSKPDVLAASSDLVVNEVKHRFIHPGDATRT